MVRARSNALDTAATIKVSGLGVADFTAMGWDPNAIYFPAPRNPSFLAAFIGNKREGHKMMGWKMHVSAYPYNAHLVAEAVLPILCDIRIWHKYVSSALLLSRMTDEQRGKFITIYTNCTDPNEIDMDTKGLAQRISQSLTSASLTGPEVPHERVLAPMVSARFSADFTKSGH